MLVRKPQRQLTNADIHTFNMCSSLLWREGARQAEENVVHIVHAFSTHPLFAMSLLMMALHNVVAGCLMPTNASDQ